MADEQYELTDGSKNREPTQVPVVDTGVLGNIEDLPDGTIKNALAKVNVSSDAVTNLGQKVSGLLEMWTGTGTKDLYDSVKRLRLDIRTLRVSVEKVAKEGREEAIKVQRFWLSAEKAATAPLNEFEDMLKAKEIQFDTEQTRVAEEKARGERERVLVLFKRLQAVEWRGNELIVAGMTAQQFENELKDATAQFEEIQALRKAEAERKAQAEKDAAELAEKNRVEAERLAKERQRLVEEDAKRQAETEKLERDKAAADIQRQKALAEVEEARQRGMAEVAEAKAKVEREALEAKQKAERQEVERKAETDRVAQAEKDARELAERKALEERQRAMAAPDRDKVGVWASKIEAVLKEAPLALAEPLSAIVVGIHRDISVAVDALKEAAK